MPHIPRWVASLVTHLSGWMVWLVTFLRQRPRQWLVQSVAFVRQRVVWLLSMLRRTATLVPAWLARLLTILRRWLAWLLTLFFVSLGGIILLPIVRKYPEWMRSLFSSKPYWLREFICLGLSMVFVFALYKQLSPRWKQLRHWWHLPPIWSAWFLAGLIICVCDLTIGLGPEGVKASLEDWMLCGGGAIVAVEAYRWLTAAGVSPSIKSPAQDKTLDELTQDWQALERWLLKESPAEEDLIGNRGLARRLSQYLMTRGGTIGLIGPFGIGKTTLIEWVIQEVRKEDPNFLFCPFSCWGFEDSATAIQQMFAKAIEIVGERADCFSFRHLPESYRKMFSTGGDWIRNLIDIVLGSEDPMHQVKLLSGVLTSMKARLVIVVEDLDRNDSNKFDRKEVQAALYRLKDYENLNLILTASLITSGDIELSKLCDHIEQMHEIEGSKVVPIIRTIREHALAQFPEDDYGLYGKDNPWGPSPFLELSRFDLVPPPGAAARLLGTPRALKRALSRTYIAWQLLHGEVDFDDLLAVNILRYGSSKTFDFLLRNWNQLHDDPRGWNDKEKRDEIAGRLKDEWKVLESQLDDPRAAFALFEFVLPMTTEYLGQRTVTGWGNRSQIQGLVHRRYWDRIRSEQIDANQARDQQVLHDLQEWLKTRNLFSALVERMHRGGDYLNVWKDYALIVFASDPAALLQLSGQVLSRFRTAEGAHVFDDEPHEAFITTWVCANRLVPRIEASRIWLEHQIREAMPSSLLLVLDLYFYWGSSVNGILQSEDRNKIRVLIHQLCREQFHSGEDLIRVAHPELQYDLYWLVFPPDHNEGPSPLRNVEDWNWLKPILLDALRRSTPLFALKIARLLSADDRPTGQHILLTIPGRLSGFFGDGGKEVIDLLKKAMDTTEGDDRSFLAQVIGSAKVDSGGGLE